MSESNKDGTGKSLSSILGESSIEINPENNTQSNEKVQSKNEQPETLLDKFIEKTKIEPIVNYLIWFQNLSSMAEKYIHWDWA